MTAGRHDLVGRARGPVSARSGEDLDATDETTSEKVSR
jgi:hypothetical protein